MKLDRQSIWFLLNGEPVTLTLENPTQNVLNYLRQERSLTGTKEGCAEGDCGACTVVLGELQDGSLHTRTVNACILFLPVLDGKALFTVEYLRRMSGGSLHPVQQAMVDCHGSQCGFCTPGFIMSLWQSYNEHVGTDSRPDRQQLADQLSGNLCRCTGYKPIFEAGSRMFDLPGSELDESAIIDALSRYSREESIQVQASTPSSSSYAAPRTLEELTQLRSRAPEATLLAGGTDVGLWVNKLIRPVREILYLGSVPELQRMHSDGDSLHIGAGVTLDSAYGEVVRYYPQLGEMEKRFASIPIRNSGTLGGNVANGSPIGDSMPWLMALGAEVELHGTSGPRRLALDALYTGYMRNAMQDDEVLASIIIPLPFQGQVFRSYKLSKRFDSDISAVCAAFELQLDADVIISARIAFGGMAATVQRAAACEQSLQGQTWTEDTLQRATEALATDYTPMSDMRASAAYRQRTAANLLKRFFLETRPDQPLGEHQTSVFTRQELAS